MQIKPRASHRRSGGRVKRPQDGIVGATIDAHFERG